MIVKSVAFVAVLLASLAQAHLEPEHHHSAEELARRELERVERDKLGHECGEAVTEYTNQRRYRRALMRRGLEDRDVIDSVIDISHLDKRTVAKRQALPTGAALTPHFSAIKTPFSCVQAPEVTEGPYYIKDEYVRGDLRQGQSGVSVYLDIGILDIRTCQPVPNAFVEIWASNASGLYSAFLKTNFPYNVSRTDPENFGRGGQFTNAAGLVELATIYPGYYTSRTIHIHTMVHTGVTVRANGTIKSDTNTLRHDGQVYFNDTLSNQVVQRPEYKSNQVRTYNTNDTIYRQSNSGGHNAVITVDYINAAQGFNGGVLGYITLGVDTAARRPIMSTEFYNPNWPNAPPTGPPVVTSNPPPQSSTNPPITNTPPPSGCSTPKYGQCGGEGFSGCNTCASGTTCTASNQYYSQCL